MHRVLDVWPSSCGALEDVGDQDGSNRPWSHSNCSQPYRSRAPSQKVSRAARQVSLVNLPRAEEHRPSLIHDGIAKILLLVVAIFAARSYRVPMGKGLRDTTPGKHKGVEARCGARDCACSSTSRSSSERLGNHTSGGRSSDCAGGDR
eukprot:scaffold44086_cov63-Phaeocystis_antarctica.AAC.8